MYLIVKESIKILAYAYLHCNEKFKVSFSFDDFKNRSDFNYSISDFLKSYSYLKETNIIRDNNLGAKLDKFEFILSPIAILLAEIYLCNEL